MTTKTLTHDHPNTLLHATPTRNVESILLEGLVPCYTFMQEDLDAEQTNLSTEDESDLVVFFGDVNNLYDDDGEYADTVTLLEVDVRDMPLLWPGQDGDHHYEARELITPDRIRVISTCTHDQMAAWEKAQGQAG